MTYIDVLNRLRSGWYTQDMETTEYVGKLEEACEKQIEKKVLTDDVDETFHTCPVCDCQVHKYMDYWCSTCGQKLDWRE